MLLIANDGSLCKKNIGNVSMLMIVNNNNRKVLAGNQLLKGNLGNSGELGELWGTWGRF